MVDPTLPSWLPPPCVEYHKVVVQAIDCKAVEQGKRDEIQKTFGDASTSWKAEQDANPERIAEIDASCTTATESVRADIGEKCI